MARFQFRLASLLKYREGLRDRCRQALAQLLHQDAELEREQQRITADRERQLDEMQHEQNSERISIDKLTSRRYHSGQLSAEIRQVVMRRQELAKQLSLCRQALVRADQGVKVLEKLADQQQFEFQQIEIRKEARELEETWSAGKLRETH
ncbi:MAG: hypothetical protein U0872_01055 [Planctomycetaceae bacterium]